MRFEKWRGMPLVLTMAAVGLGLGWASPARADGYRLHHTIPREVAAYDFTTGGEFMAPPVPYGHYAKDDICSILRASCRLHGLLGCIGLRPWRQGLRPRRQGLRGLRRARLRPLLGPRARQRRSRTRAAEAVAAATTARASSPRAIRAWARPASRRRTRGPVATSQSQPVGMAVVQPSGAVALRADRLRRAGTSFPQGSQRARAPLRALRRQGLRRLRRRGDARRLRRSRLRALPRQGVRAAGSAAARAARTASPACTASSPDCCTTARRSITSSAPAGRSRSPRDMSPTSWPRGRRATSSPSRP